MAVVKKKKRDLKEGALTGVIGMWCVEVLKVGGERDEEQRVGKEGGAVILVFYSDAQKRKAFPLCLPSMEARRVTQKGSVIVPFSSETESDQLVNRSEVSLCL